MTSHPRTLTADAFRAWAGEEFEARYELIEDRVVAMGAEQAAHGRAKARACTALDAASVYVPDAFVRCGLPVPGDTIAVDDAVIAVEVASPSTRAIDMNAKLTGYFRLPSLHHYLIVDADERFVIHHLRREAGRIETRILREGPIDFDPPSLAVTVADLLPL